MKKSQIIYVISVIALAGSVVAWLATGTMPFTRFESQENAEVLAENDLDDLFADTGLNDEQGEVGKIENRFTFGLLPSGPGKDTLSVAAISGPAAGISLGAFLLGRKNAKKNQNTQSETQGAFDAS